MTKDEVTKDEVTKDEVTKDEAPTAEFQDQETFEKWLDKHFEEQAGVWIKMAKKASGIKSITHPEALDVALCFGWIDGQRKGVDETYFVQKFTPRRKRSLWSKINTGKVEALIASGRMRPSGQAEIDRAKDDGRWDAAYDAQAASQVPEEMQLVLDSDPAVKAFYEKLSSASRFAYVFRYRNAKRADTKAKLLDKLREGHVI